MRYSMDSKIVEFMQQYRISDLEIEDIKNIAPMIDVTSYNEFVVNCQLLTSYGYPKSDLDFLLLANPQIFVMSPKDLKNDLIKLRNEYEDIEIILKENPMII